MAQRKEKADALQGGAVSAVVVTVSVDAAWTRDQCWKTVPMLAARMMARTRQTAQRRDRNIVFSPLCDGRDRTTGYDKVTAGLRMEVHMHLEDMEPLDVLVQGGYPGKTPPPYR